MKSEARGVAHPCPWSVSAVETPGARLIRPGEVSQPQPCHPYTAWRTFEGMPTEAE